VNAEPALGTLASALASSVGTSGGRLQEARDACDGGDRRAARRRLRQAIRGLAAYGHRLRSRAARRTVSDTVRAAFLDAGESIQSDLKTLRAQIQCPGGVG
jgi:hypothetical protein